MIAARIRPSPEATLDNATVNESERLESGRVRSDPRLVRFDGPAEFVAVRQQIARRMGQDSRHRSLVEDVRDYYRAPYSVGFYHNDNVINTLRLVGARFGIQVHWRWWKRRTIAVLWKSSKVPTERFKRVAGAIAGTILDQESVLLLTHPLLLLDEPHWMLRSLLARMERYAESSSERIMTMGIVSDSFDGLPARTIPPWFMNDLGFRGQEGWIKRGRRPPRVPPRPLLRRERIEWHDFEAGGDAARDAVATLLAPTDLGLAENLGLFSHVALCFNSQNMVVAVLPVSIENGAHEYLRPPSNGRHISSCPNVYLEWMMMRDPAICRYIRHLLLEWETRMVNKTVFVLARGVQGQAPSYRKAHFRPHRGPWRVAIDPEPSEVTAVNPPPPSPNVYTLTVVTNKAMVDAQRAVFEQAPLHLDQDEFELQTMVLLWKDAALVGALVAIHGGSRYVGYSVEHTALLHTESEARLVEMLRKLLEVVTQRGDPDVRVEIPTQYVRNPQTLRHPLPVMAMVEAGFRGSYGLFWKRRQPRPLARLDPRLYRVTSIDVQASLRDQGESQTIAELDRITNWNTWNGLASVASVHVIQDIARHWVMWLPVLVPVPTNRASIGALNSSVTWEQTSRATGITMIGGHVLSDTRRTALRIHLLRMWQQSSDALEFLMLYERGVLQEGFVSLSFPFVWEQNPKDVVPPIDVDAELKYDEEPTAKRVRTSARIPYDPIVDQDDPVVNEATRATAYLLPFQGVDFEGGPVLADVPLPRALNDLVMEYATPQYSTTYHTNTHHNIVPLALLHRLCSFASDSDWTFLAQCQWELVLLWRKTRHETLKVPVGMIFATRIVVDTVSVVFVTLLEDTHLSLVSAMFHRLEQASHAVRRIEWHGQFCREPQVQLSVPPWYVRAMGFTSHGAPLCRTGTEFRHVPLLPLGWTVQTYDVDTRAEIERAIQAGGLRGNAAEDARSGRFGRVYTCNDPTGQRRATLVGLVYDEERVCHLVQPPSNLAEVAIAYVYIAMRLHSDLAIAILHMVQQWERDYAATTHFLFNDSTLAGHVGYHSYGPPYWYDLPLPVSKRPLDHDENESPLRRARLDL